MLPGTVKVKIIRQEFPFFALPDFRNIGVSMRIFVSTLMLIFLLPLISGNVENGYWQHFFALASWMVPAILTMVVLLYFLNRYLHRLPWALLWVWALAFGVFFAWERFYNSAQPVHWAEFWAIGLYIPALLHYQALIQKAYSPALAQAQLSALTARIRPHFLFNSLNAAIGLIRARPTAAETILENLADLFRAQLGDSQESTLGKEIELAKGYMDIEILRMGAQRLQVQWNENAPDNAVVPPLLLQPLLENAVYHGIEPCLHPGKITVGIVRKGSWIYIRIDNPLPDNPPARHRAGNQMALKNLSERLFLMYDHDATIVGREVPGKKCYRVDIRLPYYSKSLKPPAKKDSGSLKK